MRSDCGAGCCEAETDSDSRAVGDSGCCRVPLALSGGRVWSRKGSEESMCV